jgi:hypothetical protein
MVIAATNAGLALAYSMETGEPVWQCSLDGACIHHLFVSDGHLIVAADSLYFLEPITGELRGRVHWPGLRVSFAAGTPSQIALFRGPSRDASKENNEAGQRRVEAETVLILEGTRLIREIKCSGYASAVRFSPATGRLYASGMKGLDIINPETGERLHTLRPAEMTSGNGLPDVTEDRIYVIDGDGVVFALQHPVPL